jgi:carbohydrate-selective porin OprB
MNFIDNELEENIMKKRKILSALCAIVLGITSIPTLTFANLPEVKAETTAYNSKEITGDWDDNITYTLKDGVLTTLRKW